MTVTQVPVPLHPPPLQPANVDPAAAVAVSVTDVPLAYPLLQLVPQLIPTGALITVPVPVPVLFTVSVGIVGGLKVAVMFWSPFMTTTQEPVPLQAPLHPENIDPPAGDADKVTVVPGLYALLQPSPQLMPAGLLMTVPVPAPAFVTVRVPEVDVAVNVAVTV